MQTLLYENMLLNLSDNSKILNDTTNFVLSTKRFDEALFEAIYFLHLY